MSENPGRFQVSLGAIIEQKETGKILLVKRADDYDFRPGEWEFMSGRMNQYEEPEDALRREVKEETGLDVEIIKPFTTYHIFRGEKSPEKEVIGIVFWCKTNSDNVMLSKEHDNYKWVKPENALDMVSIPGMKEDIKRFIEERD